MFPFDDAIMIEILHNHDVVQFSSFSTPRNTAVFYVPIFAQTTWGGAGVRPHILYEYKLGTGTFINHRNYIKDVITSRCPWFIGHIDIHCGRYAIMYSNKIMCQGWFDIIIIHLIFPYN